MLRVRQPHSHAKLGSAARFLWAIPLFMASLVGCEQRPITGVNPKAAEQLCQALATIRAHERFRVVIDFTMQTLNQGEKTETKTTHLLSIERPNRLALWPQGEEKGVFIVSDGEQFSGGNSTSKKYVVGQSPFTLQDIVEDFAGDFELGIGGLFFVSQSKYEDLIAVATGASDLGLDEVDGHPCQHLHFAGSHAGFDVWLEKTTPPLIRKIVVDFDQITVDVINADGVTSRMIQFGGDVVETGGQTKSEVTGSMSLVYRFHDWDLDPTFSPGLFAFVPPDDWEKVDQLANTTPEVKEPPHPLLRQAAPEFRLQTRRGEMATVAEHRGKDVVILDFWASWCGPCRESLPIVAKMAAEYRDHGVAFYAINLEETEDEVGKILADLQLDIPVVFDRDGSIGKLYYAKTIPQIFLIGKDGTVQVVHVGTVPDCAARLTEELDALLAGKNLAEQADETSTGAANSQ